MKKGWVCDDCGRKNRADAEYCECEYDEVGVAGGVREHIKKAERRDNEPVAGTDGR